MSDRRTVTASELRSHFGELAQAVRHRGERVVVTRNGRGLMALVPLEDLHTLAALPLPPHPRAQPEPDPGAQEQR